MKMKTWSKYIKTTCRTNHRDILRNAPRIVFYQHGRYSTVESEFKPKVESRLPKPGSKEEKTNSVISATVAMVGLFLLVKGYMEIKSDSWENVFENTGVLSIAVQERKEIEDEVKKLFLEGSRGIVISGEIGAGKTQIVGKIIRELQGEGIPVGYFNVERKDPVASLERQYSQKFQKTLENLRSFPLQHHFYKNWFSNIFSAKLRPYADQLSYKLKSKEGIPENAGPILIIDSADHLDGSDPETNKFTNENDLLTQFIKFTEEEMKSQPSRNLRLVFICDQPRTVSKIMSSEYSFDHILIPKYQSDKF